MHPPQWQFKPYNKEQVLQLQEELDIHPVLCQLLVQRNITTYRQAKKFFRPSFQHLHDPFLMQDMAQAVRRIQEALQRREKILIYGDYDVDGTTAVALFYSFLRPQHTPLEFYIPNRYSEGYGL